MRAIDTSIVVRYLTGDDQEQSAKARAAVDSGNVFVSTTVWLECERVLRSVYGYAGKDVAIALRAFAGLPGVSPEAPVMLADALDRVETGMDFADALHLGAAAHCEMMLTFDRRFISAAQTAAIKVMEP